MDKLAQEMPALGRIELAREADFDLGALRVRPARRTVEGGGARLLAQRRVMQVLVALARSPNEVVSQQELISRCWNGLTVGEDAIGRCIGQLRKVATAWPEPPFAIETIPGVGYQIQPRAIEIEPEVREALRRRSVRWRLGWIGAAAVIATLAGGLWLLRDRIWPPAATVRVAILPFQAMDGGAEVRALADSLPDEMLNELGANQIAPISRAGLSVDGPEAAAKLGIGFLVDGSVRRDTTRTTVDVRLEDALSHAVLWSDEFVRDNRTAQDLPLEAAAKLGDIVQIAAFARSYRPPVSDDAALADVLATHDIIRRDQSMDWARLLDLARRTPATNPDFAFGHSSLALADAEAALWSGMAGRKQALQAAARMEAQRALALDPRDAGAYYALYILLPTNAYRARLAIARAGIAHDGHPAPPLAALYNVAGWSLMAVGRFHDALPYIERSQSLDALSAVKNINLVAAYSMVGQESGADDLLVRTVKRWPDHPAVRQIRLLLTAVYGTPAECLALIDDPDARPADLTGPALDAWRAFLAARRDPGEADRAAKVIVDADERLDPDTKVVMLSMLGRTDLAYRQADAAIAKGVLNPWTLFLAQTRGLRRDPRFPRLAERLGLVDYWRATGQTPDFCAEPGLPYDCRVWATKAAA